MTQSAGTPLLQTPQPLFSSHSQSAHQLTDCASALAKVPPVCTRSLRLLVHFAARFLFCQHELRGEKRLFVFSHRHVRMKSSS